MSLFSCFVVCDGAGGTTSVGEPLDVPLTPSTVCKKTPACSGTPLAPSYTIAPIGTDCTNDGLFPRQVCGDPAVPALAGICVQCNVPQDCYAFGDGGGQFICTNGVCQ